MPPYRSSSPDLPSTSDLSSSTLTLSEIRNALPNEVFKKSLLKSLYYMFLDYFFWIGSIAFMMKLTNSNLWDESNIIVKMLTTLIYWNIAGFFMWCIFVVGHDCGHTTFSNYEIVNDVIGHITHGSILVPFYPWQLSHRRHHMYHNHIDKDYSHPWFTTETINLESERFVKMVQNNFLLKLGLPFYGWPLYLLGKNDGCHFFPFSFQRMWQESASSEYIKCIISSVVTILFGIVIYNSFDSFNSFAYFYLGPYIIFGWWLFTVTYLQHHSENSLVYDDRSWSFVKGAFETIDRKFGYGIDNLHHNITDGHVIHHLFFTKIPHYHLSKATKALKTFLAKKNMSDLYKFEETYDFFIRSHKYAIDYCFLVKLYDSNNDSKSNKLKSN